MYDVVGMDIPNIDLALNLEAFPEPDGFSAASAGSWQGGGKVATGMVAAARLGAKGAMLGMVGDDIYGRFVLADFERHGIDTAGLRVRPGKTTNMAVVLSDKQTSGRSVVWLPGNAEPLVEEEVPEGLLENTRFFYISQTNALTLKLAARARAAGAKVVIDADNYTGELEACFGVVDVFIASEFVYRDMFGGKPLEAACREIQRQGPETVVFTLGGKGSAGLGAEGYFQAPPFRVDAVDTVGAGDVYHGAFVVGLLKGWPAEKTARFASAVAAIKCTCIGGRAGIPNMQTALDFMETGVINSAELKQRVEFYTRGLDHV